MNLLSVRSSKNAEMKLPHSRTLRLVASPFSSSITVTNFAFNDESMVGNSEFGSHANEKHPFSPPQCTSLHVVGGIFTSCAIDNCSTESGATHAHITKLASAPAPSIMVATLGGLALGKALGTSDARSVRVFWRLTEDSLTIGMAASGVLTRVGTNFVVVVRRRRRRRRRHVVGGIFTSCAIDNCSIESGATHAHITKLASAPAPSIMVATLGGLALGKALGTSDARSVRVFWRLTEDSLTIVMAASGVLTRVGTNFVVVVDDGQSMQLQCRNISQSMQLQCRKFFRFFFFAC